MCNVLAFTGLHCHVIVTWPPRAERQHGRVEVRVLQRPRQLGPIRCLFLKSRVCVGFRFVLSWLQAKICSFVLRVKNVPGAAMWWCWCWWGFRFMGNADKFFVLAARQVVRTAMFHVHFFYSPLVMECLHMYICVFLSLLSFEVWCH